MASYSTAPLYDSESSMVILQAPQQKAVRTSAAIVGVLAFLMGAGVALATTPAESTSLYISPLTKPAMQAAALVPSPDRMGTDLYGAEESDIPPGPWPEKGRELVGRVVSTAMDKTVVVDVERKVLDKKYGKYVKRSKKYQAHDELNDYKNNELVMIRESRPISKTKRFVVVGRV